MSKCKLLCVPRTNDFIPISLENVSYVKELKLLGVTFDARNNWSSHVNRVVRCASRNLFLLRTLKPVLQSDSLTILFNSVVRSILEYCSPLFIGLSNENSSKLERIQRRFHRILCGKDCINLCFKLLSERRTDAAIKLFLQAKHVDHVLHRLMPTVSRSGRFLLPAIRHERRLQSFFIKVAIATNHQCQMREHS